RGHIRNVQYTERMSRIRYDLSQASGTPIGTTGAIPPTGYPIRELLLDPYQPSAIQHTLVAFINSILVALSIPSLLWGIASPGFRLVPAILSSIGALIVSLLLHRTATRILVRRHAANARP
ncbi:MAG TPA: hypothetical protein VJP78_13915, partial [Thermoleophilia bacterium]|nr:hypothetical protein [Thermoleophilia bacterium]